MKKISIVLAAVLVVLLGYYFLDQKSDTTEVTQDAVTKEIVATPTPMSFFITSKNPGNGGDLGGLDGADAYCRTLAENAGVTGKTWRAYLSTTPTVSAEGVDARSRIGNGPWHNARGEVVAANLEELHAENNVTKATALTEQGDVVSGRGDAVNMHDILTGSTADGRASTTALADTTCNNWTSSTTGSALVGHHDRVGRDESAPMKSWNAAHGSRGCDMESLKGTGGGGLFYCFVAN
jgi:hypothetical protein